MGRFMRGLQRLLEDDKGGGSGGNAGNAGSQPPKEEEGGDKGNGSTPPGSGGQGGNQDTKPPDKGGNADKKDRNPFAGIHPNRVAAIRRILTEEITDTVRGQLQAETDKAEGKWQKIAERLEPENTTLKGRVTELESELESHRDVVQKYLDARIKDWPKEWLEGDPRKRDPETPVEQVIAWMDWAEPLVKKTREAKPPPGNPPNPESNGQRAGMTPDQDAAYTLKVRESKGVDL